VSPLLAPCRFSRLCRTIRQSVRKGSRRATTHHDSLDRLAKQFPDIEVRRGLRFVESSPKLATAGGLSSGIDLALRVVERYFGRPTAERTATYMEYQGRGRVV
jgi:transcriptional regulator GlxA family with amidase domain